MTLITVESISKRYGARPLFDDLSLTISEGDRIGIIGPNGTGKSTLLRILAGADEPDTGRRAARRGMVIAWVPQEPQFELASSAEAVVEEALRASIRMPLEEVDIQVRVATALSIAGFDAPDVKVGTLSGGWRKRLGFAAALVLEPDLLLMDEPTNHLDIEAIEDLERTLTTIPRAFAVISHDRRFLENITNRVVEIHRAWPGGMVEVKGSYSTFLEVRDEKLSNLASYRDSLANTVRREVEWLRRGAKARTRKAQARIDEAGRKMGQLEETNARLKAVDRKAGIDFAASDRQTKRLLEAEGIGKSLGGRTLFRDLDVLLTPKSRIGILGSNGSGKTTLLRVLAGELEPDEGTIRRADALRVVRFEQDRSTLNFDISLARALAPDSDSVVVGDRTIHVAAWAKRFLFDPEQLVTRVGALSGGEQARVLIARLMQQPADILILDEPTNDLDIPSLEVLEDNLANFGGALILVTHDRFLLDRVTDSIVSLDGAGNAEWFADLAQWELARRSGPRAIAKVSEDGTSEAGKPKKKLSWAEQRELDAIDRKLLEAEAALERARAAANDPAVAADADELHRRYILVQESEADVERLYARWSELEEKRT